MIEFRNVEKHFKNKKVISDLSMTIEDGELVAIIGSSGCGKTTSLKMINGLITPNKGQILIDGVDISTMDPVKLRRGIGYVIQQMGLFPHLTVRENIELIQRLEKKDSQEIQKSTEGLMELVDLGGDEYLDRYPSDLSGGQQQRVGVARALANKPKIMLMDEPFSALDPITRANLQDELISLHERMDDTTIVFVSHDMDEAIKIADRICVMKDGKVLQFDTPEEIMKNPKDDFVESFVGKDRIWGSPEYIRVGDIMIKEPVICKEDLTKVRCVRRMTERHVDTLLVVDENKKFKGTINRKALYRANPEALSGDIMKTDVLVTHPEDNMVQLLKLIDEYDSSNVPVIDDKGYVAGLITNSNLVSVLSQQFLVEDDEAEEL